MPFDPVTVAATAITNVVIKTVWDEGRGLLGWIGGRLSEEKEELIFNASQRYYRTYMQRHGILKVLGMREPVKLEEVYTSVQFLGEDGVWQFASIDNLELAYRETQSRRYQAEKCVKQEGLKAANEKQFLMVLGAPGAGKSTFLRRMGLEALKGRQGKYQPECVPVFVELKRFITGDVNLEAVIIDELKTCGFPSPEESTKKLLKQGKLLILLDGLDEVPTKQLDRAIEQIEDFVDRHDKNRFIASCRTAAYRTSFRRFTDVVMSEFDDAQIQQFIVNWFRSEQDRQMGTAQSCWELLQSSEYAATKELAQTPLLLTLLCLVFDDSQTFPKNRAVLYGEALDVLLKKWASEKRIQRDPIYQDLTVALEEIMLAEIAYTNFSVDRLFFSQRDVEEQIRSFLSSNLNAPKHLDAEEILRAIQIQQGILVERARDVLSFSHLTLQEYLTAQYLADNDTKENPLIQQIVNQHIIDRRWRVVFMLVAGLLRGGANELLLQMEAKANSFVATDKLRALINWSEQHTKNSEGDYKPAAKRAVAIYCARALARNLDLALTRDRDLALTRNLDLALARNLDLALARNLARARTRDLARTRNLARALAHNLARAQIFDSVDFTAVIAELEALRSKISSDDAPIEVRRAFVESIRQTWYNALHLDSEWLALSEKEVRSLENYLYANELIVQCKEAALRVSPQVWEAIESRMLTVSDNEINA